MIEVVNNKVEFNKKSLVPNYSILRANGSIEWAFIPDMDLLKSTFERQNPTKELQFTYGPMLYYYKIAIVPKKLEK